MMRTLPPHRCSLVEFPEFARISKGTFFVRYRHNRAYADLLDIQEDKFHRLHLPVSAAHELLRLRPTNETHGNRGRVP
jgi:hypothetical protein